MFSNLIFLIIVLLMISMAPEITTVAWVAPPLLAFILGICLYGVTLLLIYFQNRVFRRKKNLLLTIANLELILFLAVYHFVLGAYRFVGSHSMQTFFAISLYLFGIGIFHYTSARSSRSSKQFEEDTPCSNALLQVRMLVPFTIPFLLFTLILDLLPLHPSESNLFGNDSLDGSLLMLLLSIAFLIVMMIFLPFFIQRIWKCKPLKESELSTYLEQLCHRAGFKHAGFKTWTIMNHTYTAAIVGVIPRFRYIMFTKPLLEKLPKTSIEAILAHEIGHNYRRHLLIYPFVIFGMVVAAGLFSTVITPTLMDYIELQNLLHPSLIWGILSPLAIFLPFLAVIIVYFRLVFGHFSRLFERQADLHVYQLNIPPENMIEALDDVAVATGFTHHHPSWHHFSIQERIDFLKHTIENPQLIEKHHKRMRRHVWMYMITLLLSCVVLFSSNLSFIPLFKNIDEEMTAFSQDISTRVNGTIRRDLAYKMVNQYQLKGAAPDLVNIIDDALAKKDALMIPGLAEFYSAEEFLKYQNYSASAIMMANAWEKFPMDEISPTVVAILTNQTQKILMHIRGNPLYLEEEIFLRREYEQAMDRFHIKENNMTLQQTQLNELKEYFEQNKEQIQEEYFTFLRFKSISSEPTFSNDVHACANWLENYLRQANFDVQQWETSSYPVVYGERLPMQSDKPTVMIYGHYDVQPVDPLELWETDPFDPTMRNGTVYARGAQDNKGQIFYVIQALKALQELPVNVKLCIEGDEETGSAGLSSILEKKRKQLSADYLVIADVGLLNATTPTVNLGARGITTMDVEIVGSNSDLHSGSHGGIVFNPIHALVEILAQLRDKQGRVTVPHFYDKVQDLTNTEKEQLTLDFDVDSYRKTFDAEPIGGEQSFSVRERNWTRPTLEINGINGGYSGEGFKTVIPAKAIAKISCRLVPNQEPDEIGALVKGYIEKLTPVGLKVTVDVHEGGGIASRAKVDSEIVRAYSLAYEEVFGKSTAFIYEGGSIPIVSELAKVSGSDLVLMGMGLASDQIHAPNEHFDFERFEKGFYITARALQQIND